MRVALVITRMNRGGTSKYLNSLASALQNSGHEVRIFIGKVDLPEIEESVSDGIDFEIIRSLHRKPSFLEDIRAYLELRARIRVFNPDIVHSHTFKAGLIVRLLPKVFPRTHTFHGHSFYDPAIRKIEKVIIWVVEFSLRNRCKYFIVTGNKTGKDLEYLRILKANWTSVNPIVRVKESNNGVDRRRLNGIANKSFVVGWLGRFAPVKRPEIVLELAKLMPDITFLMAGGGSKEWKLNKPENLIIENWRPAEEFIETADIIINTSAGEGLSISIIEAQLMGKPVICYDVGANSELIQNDVTGYVVKNLSEMRFRIREISADKKLFLKLSKNAKKLSQNRFDGKESLQKHLFIYNRIINEKA